ncbi:MAG: hypothetical protein CMJ94_00895 [Planctomycetes bacterium]|nr:hypothetical protein [Planctomycetota bacterium]
MLLPLLFAALISPQGVQVDFSFTGAPGERFGAAVAAHGHRTGSLDLQGLVVGAPGHAGDTGAYTLVSAFGNSSEQRIGVRLGDRTGQRLAYAGDLDGDGLADYIVAAPGADFRGIDSGAVSAVSGLNGAPLWLAFGERAGWGWGQAVASLGDLDGDTVPDVLVGSAEVDAVGPSTGRAVVYSGRHGTILKTINGFGVGARAGEAVCAAGDVDGDGVGDYLVGSPGESTRGSGWGAVRLYSGASGALVRRFDGGETDEYFGAGLAGGHDLDLDGVADFVVGSPGASDEAQQGGAVSAYSGADGRLLWRVGGAQAGHRIGAVLACIRDLDGDGRAELLIGNPRAGSVAPFFSAGVGAVTVISGADGYPITTLHGDLPGDAFGTSLAELGDIDRDGASEFAVGAPCDGLGGTDVGYVRVYQGLQAPHQLTLSLVNLGAGEQSRAEVWNATPNASVSLYRGRDLGFHPLPGGRFLELREPRLVMTVATNGNGRAVFTSWVGARFAGFPVRVQAMDSAGLRSPTAFAVIL